MFTKNFRDKDGWHIVKLSDEELGKIENEHRAILIVIMKECVEDAKKVRKDMWAIDAAQLIVALFDKRAPSVLTAISGKLNEKIEEMRK